MYWYLFICYYGQTIQVNGNYVHSSWLRWYTETITDDGVDMSIYRKFFYDQGKNNYIADFVMPDPSTWPKEWTTKYYKEYPRFPHVDLPSPAKDGELFSLISSRCSQRDFSGTPLSLNEVSSLLKYSCGEFEYTTPDNEVGKHRAQPSGGARYPVEMYAFVFNGSEDLKEGIYHYNVKKHSLEAILHNAEKTLLKDRIVISEWSQKASVLFVMTGTFWRTEMKYRGRGSWYTYLEAGHIAQNIHLVSEKLGLKSVGLGGIFDDTIEQLLSIDPKIEAPLHAVAVGK